VVFEWDGNERYRYAVRVSGPAGVLWEAADLPRRSLRYPDTAPPLAPGIPYTWELAAPGYPTQQTRFEILSDTEATRVNDVLLTLRQATADADRATATPVVMRTAVLFQEGLYAAAGRELESAIAKDQDEPTLRFLLAHVYAQIGLGGRAANAMDRARFLLR
jgi:hypothetical protein